MLFIIKRNHHVYSTTSKRPNKTKQNSKINAFLKGILINIESVAKQGNDNIEYSTFLDLSGHKEVEKKLVELGYKVRHNFSQENKAYFGTTVSWSVEND